MPIYVDFLFMIQGALQICAIMFAIGLAIKTRPVGFVWAFIYSIFAAAMMIIFANRMTSYYSMQRIITAGMQLTILELLDLVILPACSSTLFALFSLKLYDSLMKFIYLPPENLEKLERMTKECFGGYDKGENDDPG